MRMSTALASLVCVFGAPAAMAAPFCGSGGQVTRDLTATILGAFASLEQESLQDWKQLVTTDFVGFEGGKRLDRQQLFDLIKQAHADGRHYKWSVTEEKSQADCEIGILYYVNKGSVTDAAGANEVTWLETAAFRRDTSRWRLFFIESVRTSSP